MVAKFMTSLLLASLLLSQAFAQNFTNQAVNPSNVNKINSIADVCKDKLYHVVFIQGRVHKLKYCFGKIACGYLPDLRLGDKSYVTFYSYIEAYQWSANHCLNWRTPEYKAHLNHGIYDSFYDL